MKALGMVDLGTTRKTVDLIGYWPRTNGGFIIMGTCVSFNINYSLHKSKATIWLGLDWFMRGSIEAEWPNKSVDIKRLVKRHGQGRLF